MAFKVNKAALQRWLDGPLQVRLRSIADEIRVTAEAEAPVATGTLRASMRVESVRGRFGRQKAVEVKSSAPHAVVVHQGSGPGHIPRGNPRYWPALSSRPGGLIHWSEGRGLPPGAVARGIFAHGTPANPFLARAIERVLAPHNFTIIKN